MRKKNNERKDFGALGELFKKLSGKFNDQVKMYFRQAENAPVPKEDLLGKFDDDVLVATREDLMDDLEKTVRQHEPGFYEDPNPITFNKYPQVDVSAGKTAGEIDSTDLGKRNPHTDGVKNVMGNIKVCYLGFGGIQESALLLARNGVKNFIIVDHDLFESTNANRQALCFSDTLGRKKAEVGAEYIKQINKDANIVVHTEKCTPENIQRLVGAADIIIDGTGDFTLRTELHKFSRKAGKPVVTWAWAGYEGQMMTFMPQDPLYYDVFSYSPPSNDRGFDSAGLGILNAFVAKDVMQLALIENQKKLAATGKTAENDAIPFGSIAQYPNLMTFSLFRRNPAILRNVERIRARHENREAEKKKTIHVKQGPK